MKPPAPLRPVPSTTLPWKRWLQSTSHRVLLGGGLLVLGIILSTGALMGRDLLQTQQRERQRLELLASVLEAHASQVFEAGNLALDNLAATLTDAAPVAPALPALLLDRLQAQQAYYLQSLPFLRSLALLDAQGRVLRSTQASDQGGRVNLQQLLPQSPSSERMVIGAWQAGRGLVQPPQQSPPPSGLGYIPLLRRVQLTPLHHVLLVAQLNPDALAVYQQQLIDLSENGTLVRLQLDDGRLLSQVGGSSDAKALPLPAEGHRGSSGPVHMLDRRPLLAWHRSGTQPLAVVVQEPYAATLRLWLRGQRAPLVFMLLALTLAGGMTASAWRNARGKAQAQRERDAALQETARREQELSLLFKSVQELIFRTDAQGQIRLVNSRWQVLAHQSPELARGRHLRELVCPECQAAVDALFNPARTEGVRTAQVCVPGSEGEVRTLDISVVPLRTPEGRLRGFAGSAVDVTALLAAQAQLHEQLAYAQQLLQANPLPMGVTDLQGRFLSVNPAWEAFMRLPRSEVLGRRNQDFLPPQEAQAYDAHSEELLASGGPVCYQERLQRPDGSWCDVQVTKVCLRSAQGQLQAILVVKMDVTDLLAARHLSEQAMTAKSEFVANISHELRTPLQSILGFSELGVARGRQQPKLAGMFEDIHAAGERMLILVNDLLDLAKIESVVGAFQFDRHDVRDIIEDVGAELAPQLQAKQLQLQLQLGRAPLVAKVDPVRFAQVVRNVLANAIKFSPAGSSLRVHAQMPDEHSIYVSLHDQGPGIPTAELESIFQPFVQSSQTRDGAGGTGLGLAICQKIVTAHGGRIHASNANEGGAVFHIHLPSAGYTDTMPAALL